MKLLFSFLTLVLFLDSGSLYANSCKEVELGRTGMSHWKDSLPNGLKGELVNQIQKKDDLWEKLTPEIGIDLNPHVEFKFKFTRDVRDNLPLPKTGKISDKDYFTLQVNNQLHIELEAKFDGPYLIAGGNAGVSLTHSSHEFPGKKVSNCELYKKLIDTNTKKGKDIYDSVCVSRNKNVLVRYYEKAINFLSKSISKGLGKIVDTEKNVKYAQDPLSPLKTHSKLGIPMDHTIFFENNDEIAIGDIVEHTSFFGVTPYGVRFDLFEFVKPSYSKYKRIFRTLAFKKLLGNKVIVEVEDTIISGNSVELFRLRPKLFNLLKLNLGKWSMDNFKEQNLVQHFEVDLKNKKGVAFFKKVLFSAYTPSLKLNANSVLIDHTDYLDGVVAKDPVYKDGAGSDDKIIFKIPGALSYQKRTYENIDNIQYKGQEYTSGEKLLKRKFESKLAFDLKYISLNERDNNYECIMKLSSNSTLVLDDDSSLNVECQYYNKFGVTTDIKGVNDNIKMILNGEMNKNDSKALMLLDYSRAKHINMYTNLSFSKTEISKIVNASKDKVYNEISKLLFGEKSKNVFAEKYHKVWRSIKKQPMTKRGKSKRHHSNSKNARNCAIFFEQSGITDGFDKMYEKFDGHIGKGKGISAYGRNRCYSYFNVAKNIASTIFDIRESVQKTGRLNKVLNMITDLDKVGMAQSIMVRLAGGVNQEGVRFTYIINSPLLEKIIARSNGKKYEVENSEIRKSLSTEIEPVYNPRISDVKFLYNTCQKDLIQAVFKLNYSVENRKKLIGNISIKSYSKGTDKDFSEHSFNFNNIIRNSEGEYIVPLQLDRDFNEEEPYNAYFKIQNDEGFRLSREVKIYLKQVKELLEL